MRSLLQNSQQWQCDVSSHATPEEVSSNGSTNCLRRLSTRAHGFAVPRRAGMTMSYRRAWQLLASMNLGFDQPVATTSTGGRRGGGTEVTEFVRQLVAGNRRVESKVQSLAAQLREVRVGRVVHPTRALNGNLHNPPRARVRNRGCHALDETEFRASPSALPGWRLAGAQMDFHSTAHSRLWYVCILFRIGTILDLCPIARPLESQKPSNRGRSEVCEATSRPRRERPALGKDRGSFARGDDPRGWGTESLFGPSVRCRSRAS